MAYVEYHARCWAENKSNAKIAKEIDYLHNVKILHTYQWNEVGNRQNDYDREETLKDILIEREH